MLQSESSIDPMQRRRDEAWAMVQDPNLPHRERLRNAEHHLDAESVGGIQGLSVQQAQWRARQAAREGRRPVPPVLPIQAARQTRARGRASEGSEALVQRAKECRYGHYASDEALKPRNQRGSSVARSRKPWQSQVEGCDKVEDPDRASQQSNHQDRRNPEQIMPRPAGPTPGTESGQLHSNVDTPLVDGLHVRTSHTRGGHLKPRRRRVLKHARKSTVLPSSLDAPSAAFDRPLDADKSQQGPERAPRTSQARHGPSSDFGRPHKRTTHRGRSGSQHTIQPSNKALDPGTTTSFLSSIQGQVNGQGGKSEDCEGSFYDVSTKDSWEGRSQAPPLPPRKVRRWIDGLLANTNHELAPSMIDLDGPPEATSRVGPMQRPEIWPRNPPREISTGTDRSALGLVQEHRPSRADKKDTQDLGGRSPHGPVPVPSVSRRSASHGSLSSHVDSLLLYPQRSPSSSQQSSGSIRSASRSFQVSACAQHKSGVSRADSAGPTLRCLHCPPRPTQVSRPYPSKRKLERSLPLLYALSARGARKTDRDRPPIYDSPNPFHAQQGPITRPLGSTRVPSRESQLSRNMSGTSPDRTLVARSRSQSSSLEMVRHQSDEQDRGQNISGSMSTKGGCRHKHGHENIVVQPGIALIYEPQNIVVQQRGPFFKRLWRDWFAGESNNPSQWVPADRKML